VPELSREDEGVQTRVVAGTMFACARFRIQTVSILLLLFMHCAHSNAQNLVQTGTGQYHTLAGHLSDMEELVLGVYNIDRLKKI
jgi:hypothetical protein